MEYFFGPMLPDCGYLKLFELINYENGIVINYPETGQNELDVFVDSPKLNKMFHEMEEWSTMLQCNTVAKLNRIIKRTMPELSFRWLRRCMKKDRCHS